MSAIEIVKKTRTSKAEEKANKERLCEWWLKEFNCNETAEELEEARKRCEEYEEDHYCGDLEMPDRKREWFKYNKGLFNVFQYNAMFEDDGKEEDFLGECVKKCQEWGITNPFKKNKIKDYVLTKWFCKRFNGSIEDLIAFFEEEDFCLK